MKAESKRALRVLAAFFAAILFGAAVMALILATPLSVIGPQWTNVVSFVATIAGGIGTYEVLRRSVVK